MLLKKDRERQRVFVLGLAIGVTVSLMSFWFCGSASAFRGGPYIWPSDAGKKVEGAYRSPEGAVRALVEALSANDEKKLSAILGSKGKELVFPGAEVDSRAARERFLQAYQEKNRIIKVSSNRAVLETGNEGRPFPIPIEKIGGDWRFSAKHGKVELLEPPEGKK